MTVRDAASGMESVESDPREEALQRLLDSEGLTAKAGSAGRTGEIAAVRCSADLWAELAELAPKIRALGFQYIALELG